MAANMLSATPSAPAAAFLPSLPQAADAPKTTVLRAARLLDVESGKMLMPGEVLVRGERIAEVGTVVRASARRGSD